MSAASFWDPHRDLKLRAVRDAEARSAWAAAAKLWRELDRPKDAETCEMLAAVEELSDAWRALPEPRQAFREFALQYRGGEVARRLLREGVKESKS